MHPAYPKPPIPSSKNGEKKQDLLSTDSSSNVVRRNTSVVSPRKLFNIESVTTYRTSLDNINIPPHLLRNERHRHSSVENIVATSSDRRHSLKFLQSVGEEGKNVNYLHQTGEYKDYCSNYPKILTIDSYNSAQFNGKRTKLTKENKKVL